MYMYRLTWHYLRVECRGQGTKTGLAVSKIKSCDSIITHVHAVCMVLLRQSGNY